MRIEISSLLFSRESDPRRVSFRVRNVFISRRRARDKKLTSRETCVNRDSQIRRNLWGRVKFIHTNLSIKYSFKLPYHNLSCCPTATPTSFRAREENRIATIRDSCQRSLRDLARKRSPGRRREKRARWKRREKEFGKLKMWKRKNDRKEENERKRELLIR